jgi:hypothetical protein
VKSTDFPRFIASAVTRFGAGSFLDYLAKNSQARRTIHASGAMVHIVNRTARNLNELEAKRRLIDRVDSAFLKLKGKVTFQDLEQFPSTQSKAGRCQHSRAAFPVHPMEGFWVHSEEER